VDDSGWEETSLWLARACAWAPDAGPFEGRTRGKVEVVSSNCLFGTKHISNSDHEIGVKSLPAGDD